MKLPSVFVEKLIYLQDFLSDPFCCKTLSKHCQKPIDFKGIALINSTIMYQFQ